MASLFLLCLVEHSISLSNILTLKAPLKASISSRTCWFIPVTFVCAFAIIFPYSLTAQSSFDYLINRPSPRKLLYSTAIDTSIEYWFPFNGSYFPIYSDSVVLSFGQTDLNEKQTNQFDQVFQNGSITRGILIGNTQDASIESGMDLRFTAKIGDSTRVFASLTDQNTPIQPDGSSLQLREFDRVLMGVESARFSSQLGDVDLQLKPHQFLRLNRRIMGVQAEYQFDESSTNKDQKNRIYGGLAALRGDYQVSLLDIREGFKGPYRLTDQTGEPFVIVLAGSEQVYLNGKKLERGVDRDYIIDYSFGEILFTGKHLMRASDRVRVEYQYMSRDYPEMMAVAAYEKSFEKFGVSYQLATKRSIDSQASGILLSDADRNLLAQAGDDFEDIQSLQTTQIDDSDNNSIRYTAIDSLIGDEVITIYEFDPEGDFRIYFSRTARGEGDYERDTSNAYNGIVYRFVGKGQGQFSPFRQLQAPNSLSIQSTEFWFKPLKNILIESSFAQSFEDQNLYSSQDDADNLQMAFNSRFQWQFNPLTAFTVQYQQTASDFSFFDRIREPEFERDWGITSDALFGEKLLTASIQQKTKKGSDLSLSFGQFEQQTYDAHRFMVNARLNEEFMKGTFTISRLQSANSSWDQWGQELQLFTRQLGMGQIYLLNEIQFEERKGIYHSSASSINTALFGGRDYFNELQFGLGYEVSERFNIRSKYGKREEDITGIQNELQRRSTRLWSTSADYTGKSFKSVNRFNWFGISDSPSFALNSQQRFSSKDQGLRVRIGYEADSRLQGVLNEIYTYVGPQFGNYYWDDINQDGIEQLDEFFPERSPEEGTHILQLLPSEILSGITAIQTALKLEWMLHSLPPFSMFKDNNSGPGFEIELSRKEENRSTSQAELLKLQPSYLLNDSLTISGRLSSSQKFFWRQSPFFTPIRLSHFYQRSLNNRTSFSEQAQERNFKAEVALRFNRRLQLALNLERNYKQRFSPTLVNRNFDIQSWSVSMEVKKVYSSSGSTSILSEIEWGNGALSEKFQAVRLSTNFRWNWKGGPLNFAAGYRFSQVDESFSALANFELTGGQGIGSQLFTDVRYSRDLGKGLRIDLSWSLRTRAESNALQTARISLNSVF